MSKEEKDKFRDYILENWGNTVITQGRRIMMIDDRIRVLETREYAITEQLQYLLQKTEELLKNVYQLDSEFYFEDDIKEIVNGLTLVLATMPKKKEK